VAADIDERSIELELTGRGALPVVVARQLAGAKASVVSLAAPARYVLGADQVVAFDDQCWSKARDRGEAADRFRRLVGHTHYLVSACAIARDGALLYEGCEIAEMRMRNLSANDIAAYFDLAGPEVLASVGCYRIEGVGRLLFERVEADQAVILGLPLTGLLDYLRSARLIRL
jgi:septum formation protein